MKNEKICHVDYETFEKSLFKDRLSHLMETNGYITERGGYDYRRLYNQLCDDPSDRLSKYTNYDVYQNKTRRIHNWLFGKNPTVPDDKTIAKLCSIFHVDREYFFFKDHEYKDTGSDYISNETGLSEEAVDILINACKKDDSDTIIILDTFIRECLTGSAGSPSLVSCIKEYKHSSDIIYEFNNLPDDKRAEVKPEGHSIEWNEDKQAAYLYHASKIFSDMIAKYFNVKNNAKR